MPIEPFPTRHTPPRSNIHRINFKRRRRKPLSHTDRWLLFKTAALFLALLLFAAAPWPSDPAPLGKPYADGSETGP